MKSRPDVISGATYKMDLNKVGAMYVTINDDESGQPFEVFIQIGKSGGLIPSITEALGRLVSLCLRSGVDASEVAKQLVGIRGPELSFWQSKPIFSIPDALGKAILFHIKKTEADLMQVSEDPADDGEDSEPAKDEGAK